MGGFREFVENYGPISRCCAGLQGWQSTSSFTTTVPGFRSGCSCQTQQDYFYHNNCLLIWCQVDCMVLDFKRTCITVPHTPIVHKLTSLNLPGWLRWLADYGAKENYLIINGSRPSCTCLGYISGESWLSFGTSLFLIFYGWHHHWHKNNPFMCWRWRVNYCNTLRMTLNRAQGHFVRITTPSQAFRCNGVVIPMLDVERSDVSSSVITRVMTCHNVFCFSSLRIIVFPRFTRRYYKIAIITQKDQAPWYLRRNIGPTFPRVKLTASFWNTSTSSEAHSQITTSFSLRRCEEEVYALVHVC